MAKKFQIWTKPFIFLDNKLIIGETITAQNILTCCLHMCTHTHIVL